MNEAPNVACTNDECPEFEVVKANLAGSPVETIACGACGQPCESVPAADAT